MRICPNCGTPLERKEKKGNYVLFVCPICGFSETAKVTKEIPTEEGRGIRIKIEQKGEGVVEEKKSRVEISEEELESVLEILESSESTGG